MQIERLFQIVYILLDKRQITAKALAETFEVSTRTIYRDVETLSIAGIPIYTSKGKGGGIHLLDNFVMNKSVLSKEEQTGILIGLETLKVIEYGDVDSAILKLKNLFAKNTDHWIEVDFSNWGSSKEEITKFDTLKSALIESKTIKFNYYNVAGEMSDRMVNPIKLVFKHRAWYLQAFCLIKKGLRNFKVHRIKDLLVMNQKFDRDDYIMDEPNYSDQKPEGTMRLELLLLPQVKHRVYDEFDEKDIIKNEDGSFNVEVMIVEDEWLYNYIISFGEYIKVIRPKYINDIIKKRLETTLENYK